MGMSQVSQWRESSRGCEREFDRVEESSRVESSRVESSRVESSRVECRALLWQKKSRAAMSVRRQGSHFLSVGLYVRYCSEHASVNRDPHRILSHLQSPSSLFLFFFLRTNFKNKKYETIMDSSNSKEQETSLAEPLLPLVPATDHHEVVVLVARKRRKRRSTVW